MLSFSGWAAGIRGRCWGRPPAAFTGRAEPAEARVRILNTGPPYQLRMLLPPGSFLMGSPESEEGSYKNEGPVHQVRITPPFAVGVYEVTVGQFNHFVRVTGYSTGDSCWVYEGGSSSARSDLSEIIDVRGAIQSLC